MAQRGKYTLKTYTSELYTWTPPTPTYKQTQPLSTSNNYCTAIAGSQGEDWTTGYVYNITINTGVVQRLAYVACDYVQ